MGEKYDEIVMYLWLRIIPCFFIIFLFLFGFHYWILSPLQFPVSSDPIIEINFKLISQIIWVDEIISFFLTLLWIGITEFIAFLRGESEILAILHTNTKETEVIK